MNRRDIVVIGASAGGVEALATLVGALPADLAATIFVTVHLPPHAISALPRILSRVSRMEVLHAADAVAFRPGRIYIAPPDHHLLLGATTMRLVRGPTENGNRPAIDPMFRSAAVHHGSRVIGVVLTGSLDDGTAGMLAVRRHGGVGVAQDPEDAMFSSMPASAIEQGGAEHVVRLAALPELLGRLTQERVPEGRDAAAAGDAKEDAIAALDLEAIEAAGEPSTAPAFGCPDCGGVLWEIRDGRMVRFRCRVGHGWTSDALFARQSEALDEALWTALRALEESAALARQIAERLQRRGNRSVAAQFSARADTADRRAETIRDALLGESVAEGDVGGVLREGAHVGEAVEVLDDRPTSSA